MKSLIDLHLHIDGSLPYATVKKLCRAHGQPDYTHAQLFEKMSVPASCHNLNEYLQKFAFPLTLMQTRGDLRDVQLEHQGL